MEYFFHETLLPTDTQVELSEDSARHIISVLRKQTGDYIALVNGRGLYAEASLFIQGKKKAIAHITAVRQEEKNTNSLTMAVGFTRNAARNEWMVEKLTELGCKKIIPIVVQRSVKTHFRWERFKNISIAALIQSQQLWLTEITPAGTLQEVVQQEADIKLIAHCAEQKDAQSLSNFTTSASGLVLIGPEGDFTADEIALAISNDFVPITLGHRRLRTETAAISVAAFMNIYSR